MSPQDKLCMDLPSHPHRPALQNSPDHIFFCCCHFFSTAHVQFPSYFCMNLDSPPKFLVCLPCSSKRIQALEAGCWGDDSQPQHAHTTAATSGPSSGTETAVLEPGLRSLGLRSLGLGSWGWGAWGWGAWGWGAGGGAPGTAMVLKLH